MDKESSNSNLCNCPFCKREVANKTISFGTGDVVGQVYCPVCGAQGPEAHCDCEECAMKESARLWNSPLLQFYMGQVAIEEEVERRR
jgi:predicted amidophosphoribosyltransferase